MICQRCGKNAATTHIKTIVNGELTEYSLCAECAKSLGYGNIFSDFGLHIESLFNLFDNDNNTDEICCPKCGSTFEDIVKSGRVGCAECYKTFYERFMPSIQKIHGNTVHCGKHPGKAQLQVRPQTDLQVRTVGKMKIIDYKKEQMQKAVEEQNFEIAAILRDEIRQMEKEAQKNE